MLLKKRKCTHVDKELQETKSSFKNVLNMGFLRILRILKMTIKLIDQ